MLVKTKQPVRPNYLLFFKCYQDGGKFLRHVENIINQHIIIHLEYSSVHYSALVLTSRPIILLICIASVGLTVGIFLALNVEVRYYNWGLPDH